MSNYFELFEIPVSFTPDKQVVKEKYFALSRQFHPDYFAQAGDEEQTTALETSAQINKGFKTLTNKDALIKYVLELKGLLVEDEKYNLPPAFLMEMMDINEQAEELQISADPSGKEAVTQQLKSIENELYEPVANTIENYKENVTTQEALLQVKDYYFKKKYLARIYNALEGML